jgi:hypothetical protein
VHGVSGEVYSIVSDSDLQYNSRFVFLESGECPVVDGVEQQNCFTHPGSYLGELGLKSAEGDRIHILSGGAQQGLATVQVNGFRVPLHSTVLLQEGRGAVSLNTTHVVTVRLGKWTFIFENSDHYINQVSEGERKRGDRVVPGVV